jgi:opacity protein-like surface antigen
MTSTSSAVTTSGAGTTFTTTSNFGLNSSASVFSAMANGLLDFGGNGHLGGYAGGGVGYANVKQFGDSKGKLAWQLIAGVYAPISGNLDVGLKYRYFHAGSNNASRSIAFSPGATDCGPVEDTFACSGGTVTFNNSSKFTSNSILASLVYNFGGASAPPASPAAAASASGSTGDADLPGWIGDPGDQRLPGASASASSAAGRARRARPVSA